MNAIQLRYHDTLALLIHANKHVNDFNFERRKKSFKFLR